MMIPNEIKALLLDLDGTLINSEKAFFKSFKEVLQKFYNVNITMEDYKKYELEQNAMLLKKIQSMGLISSDVNIINEIMNKIYNDYEKKFLEVIAESDSKTNFELLKALKEQGVILALVTTCRRHYINLMLKELNIEKLFDYIVAREDVKKLKPDSEAYIMALKELSLKANECVAIEDSKRGIDAAVNANIPTIKVDNFTTIKFDYPAAIEMHSATVFFEKILKNKSK